MKKLWNFIPQVVEEVTEYKTNIGAVNRKAKCDNSLSSTFIKPRKKGNNQKKSDKNEDC